MTRDAAGVDREYPYQPSRTALVLGGLFFVGCAAGMAVAARTNVRGLVLNGILEFSAQGASTFYWIVSAASCGMVLAAAAGLVRSHWVRQRVALTATALIVPRSAWSSQAQSIPYAAMTGLSMSETYGQRVLTVTHQNGKATIAAAMLPTKDALDEIQHLLVLGMERGRASGGE